MHLVGKCLCIYTYSLKLLSHYKSNQKKVLVSRMHIKLLKIHVVEKIIVTNEKKTVKMNF